MNGKKVFELGQKVNPSTDRIVVDGKPLKSAPEFIYVMFNKPRGVLTTLKDPFERPTVADYLELENVPYRLFPIGRLDWDSEGLLLLTNDGEYANMIMNPKAEITKTYLVKVDGQPTDDHLAKLKRGVSIIGGRVSARHIERVKMGKEKYSWLKVIISEGKNRQLRQMFAKIGFDVIKLQRVAIGRLRIGNLDRGQMVFLNEVAAERVFLQDNPEELLLKKNYRGRHADKGEAKRTAKAKSASHKNKSPRPKSKNLEMSSVKSFDNR